MPIVCYGYCMDRPFLPSRPPSAPAGTLRRQLLLAATGSAAALALQPVMAMPSAASSPAPGPAVDEPKGARSISIPQSALQAAVAAKFPLARSWQGLVVLQLQRPVVQLLADSNSLRTAIELHVTEKLMGTHYPGNMTLDFGLRFDDADASIRMHDVRVQQLHMQGVPTQYQPLFQNYAPRLAEQALTGLVLYELPASQKMLLSGLGYTVHRIDVQPQQLKIVLAPQLPVAK